MSRFLRALAGLCLMRMLLDMMLPEGEAKNYAGLGVGLMLMLAMLQALLSLLQGGL